MHRDAAAAAIEDDDYDRTKPLRYTYGVQIQFPMPQIDENERIRASVIAFRSSRANTGDGFVASEPARGEIIAISILESGDARSRGPRPCGNSIDIASRLTKEPDSEGYGFSNLKTKKKVAELIENFYFDIVSYF